MKKATEPKEKTIVEIEKEVAHPFVIVLKNLTEEKLYDISLLNREHEKQNKIQYSSGFDKDASSTFFNSILREFEYKKIDISLIRIQGFNCFQKYNAKQLTCPILFLDIDANGKGTQTPIHQLVSVYQMQPDIVQGSVDCRFTNNCDFIFNYLMPEQTIVVYLYPSKIAS